MGNGSHPYTVVGGDDYATIARKEFGDSSLANAISMANGGQVLTAGQVIQIPQLMATHNGPSVAYPYQLFVSIIEGNVLPFITTPYPKHSAFKQIVGMVVMGVAILLTVPTGGASLLGLGAQVATMFGVSAGFSLMVINGIVAALIDAALQGVLAGFGVKEFSIAESISAGFGAAGSGLFLGANSTVASTLITENALKASGINIAEQLTLMALGKQKQLDFTQAAAAFLGATMDAQLAKHIGFMKPMAQTAVHNVSSIAINGLLKGRIDLEQAATQMLSSAILNISAPALKNGLAWADRAVFNNQATRQMQSQQNSLQQRKHHSNARKENVHRVSSTHTRKALSPQAFMDKMGIGSLKKDLDEAMVGLNFEEEIPQSYIPSIKRSMMVKHTQATAKSSGFMDYVEAFNQGVETARDGLVHGIVHPIERVKELGNLLKEVGIFSFDGFNSSTDLLFNVSTQGARDRNLARVATVDKFQTEFANANGSTRLHVITSVTSGFIIGGAVKSLAVKAAPLAGNLVVEPFVNLKINSTKFKGSFFNQNNKGVINVGSLDNPLPRSLDNARTREWYHKELDKIPSLINPKLTLRQRALKTFALRNEIKIKARELMIDQELAKTLALPSSLKKMVRKLYTDKHMVGDDIWLSIIESSKRTNMRVDESLGMLNPHNMNR